MAEKKYISLSKLTLFFSELQKIFSPLAHKHKISDISDYSIDTEMSSTSNNPIANKTVTEAINKVSTRYTQKEVTLLASDWSETFPYEISISIEDVTSDTDVQALPNYDWTTEEVQVWQDLQLISGNTFDGLISFKAYGEKPNINIPITLLIGGNIS